jgi:hypothetical protein
MIHNLLIHLTLLYCYLHLGLPYGGATEAGPVPCDGVSSPEYICANVPEQVIRAHISLTASAGRATGLSSPSSVPRIAAANMPTGTRLHRRPRSIPKGPVLQYLAPGRTSGAWTAAARRQRRRGRAAVSLRLPAWGLLGERGSPNDVRAERSVCETHGMRPLRAGPVPRGVTLSLAFRGGRLARPPHPLSQQGNLVTGGVSGGHKPSSPPQEA